LIYLIEEDELIQDLDKLIEKRWKEILPPTQVLQDCGFRLNLKLVLYLWVQCLTESFGFFSPQPRKAWERYMPL
jgi:hypothetical protein